MFLDDEGRLDRGSDHQKADNNDRAKNNIFSRNAEFLVGKQNANPRIKDLDVNNLTFKQQEDYSTKLNSLPQYRFSDEQQTSYPRQPRSTSDYDPQKPQSAANPQSFRPLHHPNTVQQLAPTNSKAREALTSDNLKDAFTWSSEKDEHRRPPLHRKQQGAGQVADMEERVFGQLDRHDPNDLGVVSRYNR